MTRIWKALVVQPPQISYDLVEYLPVLVPLWLTIFGFVSIILLLLSQLSLALVVGLGAPLSYFATRHMYSAHHPSKTNTQERHIVGLVVLAVIVIWGVFNMFFVSQHVFVDRDPGIYTNSAKWLVSHDSLDIPNTQKIQHIEGITNNSGEAFVATDSSSNSLSVQGSHLLPALAGLVGRVFGARSIFYVGILFGCTALLSVYGFARELMHPLWALFSVVVLALNLPMIYFSRDLYTEPLTMTFIFGGLAILWSAFGSKSTYLWLIAGLVLGASMMARIDSGMLLLGAPLCAVLYLLLDEANKDDTQQRAKQGAVFLCGVVAIASVGLIDVIRIAPAYYIKLQVAIIAQIAVFILASIAFIAVCFLKIRTNKSEKIVKLNYELIAKIAVFGLLSIVVFLGSRPLWYIGHDKPSAHVQLLQTIEGYVSQPSRSYSEQTLNWLQWYVGTIACVLGVLGLCMQISGGLKAKKTALLVGEIFFFTGTVVYLWFPSISPDQIWAIRRFLPVTIPFLIISCAYALGRIARYSKLGKFYNLLLTGFMGLLVVGSVLGTSIGFLMTKDTNQLGFIKQLCASLPNDSSLVWVGNGASIAQQSVSLYCSNSNYSLQNPNILNITAMSKLSDYNKHRGKKTFVALVGTDLKSFPELEGCVSAVTSGSWIELEKSLYRAPNKSVSKNESILIGLVNSNGQITAIN